MLSSTQQLQTEINNFETRISRLRAVKQQLAENLKVGAQISLDHDMSRLETEWVRVGNVANGSLDTLWAEHSDWVDEMLNKMEIVVAKAQGLFDIQNKFVNDYPLTDLMVSDANKLLEDVKNIITTHEVSLELLYLFNYMWVTVHYTVKLL